MINTPEGCKCRQISRFLHPSGAPLIDIYQAGAQRTLGAVVSPLLLLTPSALPSLQRTTHAVTGNPLTRVKSQAGVKGHTQGTALHGSQWDAEQLRRATQPGRALHDEGENHHWVSNVHHHRSRCASKPAIGTRCHRTTAAMIAGGIGSRCSAVADHRRTR